MKKKFRIIQSGLAPYDWHVQRFLYTRKPINIFEPAIVEIWETFSKCSKRKYARLLKSALENYEPAFVIVPRD